MRAAFLSVPVVVAPNQAGQSMPEPLDFPNTPVVQRQAYETKGPFGGLRVRAANALRNGGYRSRDAVVLGLRTGKLRAFASILDYGLYTQREVLRWVGRADDSNAAPDIEALGEIALVVSGFMDTAPPPWAPSASPMPHAGP